MENFTEAQINGMISQLKEDFGPEIATRELAILELKDMKRKGCLLERADGYCINCSATANGGECPMNDWDRRHPEYKDDELAKKIKILEAGGEEAYNKKMLARYKAEHAKRMKINEVDDCRQELDKAVIRIRNADTQEFEKEMWKEFDNSLEIYVQMRINLALKDGIISLK